MNKVSKKISDTIDKVNTVLGYFSMYLVLVMMAILLFEAIMRTIFNKPHIWAVEMTEFVMAAYYTLGGGYSHLIESHVRMDLIYHKLSERNKAIMDIITFPLLFFYLFMLLYGAIKGLRYSIVYHQKTYTAWAPPVAPVKFAMTVGIIFMMLQAISELLKDIARARGEDIPRWEEIPYWEEEK